MGLLAFWVYMGGIFSQPTRKVGFSNRLFWPMQAGVIMAAWVFDRSGGDE